MATHCDTLTSRPGDFPVRISGSGGRPGYSLVGHRREPLEATAAALRGPHALHVADVTAEADVAAMYEATGAFAVLTRRTRRFRA